MRTLVVLKTHPYEGRARQPGDEYPATESDARLLVLSGQARYKNEPAAVSLEKTSSGEREQTYQTRDLAVLAASSRRRRTKVLAA